MLSRSQRLSGEQVELVMKKGRVFHSSFFWLRTLEYDGKTKIVVIVPQKVVKTAAGRNLSRRRMYGAIQSLYPLVKTKQLIILCAKNPVITIQSMDLVKEINNIFVKSKLLE